MRQLLFILVLLATHFSSSQASIICINEIMANNDSNFSDHKNNYSDWIELYNKGEEVVTLKDYYLSDDLDVPKKWRLPAISIPAKGFAVVYASGRSKRSKKNPQANFKIDRKGESIYLFSGSGALIDVVNAVALNKNVSYGRVLDGDPCFERQFIPSPNKSNNFSNGIVFSHETGFYSSDFELTLNSKNGDTIHYSLNGAVPTANSNYCLETIAVKKPKLDKGQLSQIRVSPKVVEVKGPIMKGVVIRAATFKNGEQTSEIYTKSFFITPEGQGRYPHLDVVSLVTDNGNLFRKDTGIYVPGSKARMKKNYGNYFKRGRDWERSAHFTLIGQNGTVLVDQDIGIRINGGKTRKNPQKSFRLYARKEYGASHFNYRFFDTSEQSQFKKLVLRSGMSAWGGTIFKDECSSEICQNLNVEVLGSRATVVFLNGEFWGIYAIREYFDERYLAKKYQLKKADINIVLHGAGNRSVDYDEDWGVEFGELGNMKELYSFLDQNSLKDSINYRYVETLLDMKSIIDYYCAELYFNNKDWPTNNNKLWRPNNGKWRQVLYDMDSGWSGISYNHLNYALSNSGKRQNAPYATKLFRSLTRSSIFIKAFTKRMLYLMENDFNPDRVMGIVNKYVAIYSGVIDENINRWSNPVSPNEWKAVLLRIKAFAEYRPKNMRKNLIETFKIDLNDIDAHQIP